MNLLIQIIWLICFNTDPVQLREFLDERKKLEEAELKVVAEKRAAKMMRASANAAAGAKK